jgi:hypothetical protein
MSHVNMFQTSLSLILKITLCFVAALYFSLSRGIWEQILCRDWDPEAYCGVVCAVKRLYSDIINSIVLSLSYSSSSYYYW